MSGHRVLGILNKLTRAISHVIKRCIQNNALLLNCLITFANIYRLLLNFDRTIFPMNHFQIQYKSRAQTAAENACL